jgi:hypothetical protein
MRTSLLLIVLLSVNVSLTGQGIVNFSNASATFPEQKVYIDEWLNPAKLVPGGEHYLVALYFSQVDDDAVLTQVGSAVGFIGPLDPPKGMFLGGNRTVSTATSGGVGFFQVRGWESAYGNTYEEAAANPAARVGKSSVFIFDTASPDTPEPPRALTDGDPYERSFRGFVIAVPEPSTGALALVGVVTIALVVRCRRA